VKGPHVTWPGRPALTAAAVTVALVAALLLVTHPARAARTESPASSAASSGVSAPQALRAPTAVSRVVSSTGSAFWANLGVEQLAHPGSPARRARLLLGVMRGQRATVAMLAETTGRQARALRREARGGYAVVAARRHGETNAVVFSTHAYRLLRVVRFRTFGYHGRRVPAAIAVLRDRSTGARIGALAVHHPASNTRRGTQARWQRASWRRELRVLHGLRSAYDGRISMFLGGDFNQRSTCRLVDRTGLVSPVGTVSSCPTARTRIDQLFADTSVTFSDYRAIRHGPARRATDHAGMYATSFSVRQPR
jgi:hypothetical protein